MSASKQDIQNQKDFNSEIEKTKSFEQELVDLLQRRAGILESTLSDQQDIANVIEDQVKEMKFQVSEQRLIKQISKDITKISEKTYTISKNELGLSKTNSDIKALQVELDTKIVLLTSQQNKLYAEGGRTNVDIANSLGMQVKQAQELKADLTKISGESEEIANNLGTKFFGGLSGAAGQISKITGIKDFSKPFADASEAARKQAQFNKENFGSTRGLSKQQKIDNKLVNNKLKSYKKLRSEGLNISDAMKKTGLNAKQVKVGKLPTKSLSAFSAGFKALGPVIAKAMGPLAIFTAIVKVAKFFFNAMVGASKATADMSRNMLISKEAAQELYSTTIPGIVGEFNEIQKAQGKTAISATAYQKALSSINEELGMQLNLAEDFGKQTAMNVAEVARMQVNFGLSAKASKQLFLEATKTGVPLEEMNKSMFGTLGVMSAQSGLQLDLNKVIEEAAGISGNMRANFGGSTEAIAKAVFQAKLLGLNLSQMEGVSNNLLDFQSSIEAEMEAELLTGKQLNLERARQAALMGDTETLMKEISEQAGSQEDFLKMNIIQRQALARAVGMEVNELADMYEKQAKNDALAKKNLELQNKLRKDGKSLLSEEFDIKTASLAEIRIAAQKAGKSEEELRDLLGEQIYLRKQEEDATQKFNRALERAKEAFARLVDGGALDKIADALIGIADSALFSGFAEEGEAIRIQKELEEKAAKDPSSISQEELDIADAASNQITGVEKTATVAGAALTGAAIGSIVPGVGTAVGAVVGGLVGGISSLFAVEVADAYKEGKLEEAKTIAKEQGIEVAPTDKVDDFILRPGQPPIKFNKDDLLIGGTNLGGSNNNNEVTTLLKELISAVKQGGDVYIDGAKAGRSLALATSRMG